MRRRKRPGVRVGLSHAAWFATAAFVAVWLVGCTGGSPRTLTERSAITLPGTPQGVDAPVFGPVKNAAQARAAFDGDNYLVVWGDDRTRTTAPAAARNIYAARVSGSGGLLDPDNLSIPETRPERDKPAVAFDGQRYLVVWQERGGNSSQWAVRGILFGTDGRPAGQSFAISADRPTYGCIGPSVAFDGTNYVVAWQYDTGSSSSIAGARVTTAGVNLDATQKTIVSMATSPPVLISHGGGIALAWQRGSSVYAGRAAADLNSLTATSPALGSGNLYYGNPLASTAAALWVAWVDTTGGVQAGLHVRRVDPTTLAPLADSLLVGPASQGEFGYPAFIVAGNSVAVTSSRHDGGRDYEQVITRFDASGNVTGTPQQTLIPNPAWALYGAVAPGDGGGLLVWTDARHGGYATYAARLTAAAESADGAGVLVSRGPNNQVIPIASANASGFLLGWLDDRDGGEGIYATAVDMQGAVARSTAATIATGKAQRSNLSIATDGTRYLAAWNQDVTPSSPVVGRFISANGDPDGPELALTGNLYAPRLAFGGGVYLVLGHRYVNNLWNVVSARVSATGQTLDATEVVVATDGFTPKVVSDGQNFLAYWRKNDTIEGVRISASTGQPLDATPRVLTPPNAGVTDYPEATFGAGRYLLVWDTSASPTTLVGARLETDLTIVDTTPIQFAIQTTQSSGNGTVPGWPSAAFDGTRYVIAHGTFILMSSTGTTYDTKFTAISTAGVAQTPVTVTMNDVSGRNFDPRAIAATPNGRAIVSYTLYDRPLGYDVTRVRFKTYSTTRAPLGGGCNTNADCAMGTCVDGVCCSSTCAGGATDCQACNLISGSSSNGACEPLENGTACGTRGACQSGACVIPPDPGTGGSAGSGTAGSSGIAGMSGAGGGGTPGGGSSGTAGQGGSSTAGSGGTISEGGESAGGAAGEDSTGGGASGTTSGGSSGGRASGTTAGDGGNNAGSANQPNDGDSRSDESSGCGCRTARMSNSGPLGFAWVVALAVLRRRRR